MKFWDPNGTSKVSPMTVINEIQAVFILLRCQNTEFRSCGAVASVQTPAESDGFVSVAISKYLRRPDKNEYENVKSI